MSRQVSRQATDMCLYRVVPTGRHMRRYNCQTGFRR